MQLRIRWRVREGNEVNRTLLCGAKLCQKIYDVTSLVVDDVGADGDGDGFDDSSERAIQKKSVMNSWFMVGC